MAFRSHRYELRSALWRPPSAAFFFERQINSTYIQLEPIVHRPETKRGIRDPSLRYSARDLSITPKRDTSIFPVYINLLYIDERRCEEADNTPTASENGDTNVTGPGRGERGSIGGFLRIDLVFWSPRYRDAFWSGAQVVSFVILFLILFDTGNFFQNLQETAFISSFVCMIFNDKIKTKNKLYGFGI